MTTVTLDVQKRLRALGDYHGELDGIPGRLTIRAVKDFEGRHDLDQDGHVTPAFLDALNKATGVSPSIPALGHEIVPPWVDNIRPYIGLQEKRDGRKLRDYLDSDGSTVGDPQMLPWCGDLVQTALALTLPEEALPSNPFYALNWASWGVPAPAAMVPLGAIGTKKRLDSKGKLVGGHVFIVVGHDATHFHALAGNQNNSICIALISKSALNGTLRWPRTYPLPTKGMAQTTIDATIKTIEGAEHVVVSDHASEA